MKGPDVSIYTDGSSRGNPGPGGYGIVMISGQHRKEMSKGFRKTTNNRMELLSVIVALETLKVANCQVTIFSDSQYVVHAIEKKWIDSWIKRNWKNVKNPDLWKRYLQAAEGHSIKFKWIKGHNGHPLNERCDELAVTAATQGVLEVDSWYELNGDA